MVHKGSCGPLLAILLLSCLGAAAAQLPASQRAAQSAAVVTGESRISGDWSSSTAASIPASKPSRAIADPAVLPVGTRLDRLVLLLEPSTAQQQALTKEIEDQQNSVSPEYHHWLTSAAFADAYSNSAMDVAAISDWLSNEGFQVAPLPAGRGWVEFSGTAVQVEQAFHTSLGTVATAVGTRAILAGDISVPSALRPLIHGLVSLDGILAAPAMTTPRPMPATAAELAAEPSPFRAEALTPQLVAQILHLDALHSAGQKGAGQTIAVAARSNVLSGDIDAFRAAFSLSAKALIVTPDGPDPGRTGDEAEAVMAASWAGAAAPEARILLVPAATTAATDGLDLALASIIDRDSAKVVAVGYSACEASLSESHQAFYAALYRQAAAEGIAVIASTGDSGPAACHAAGSDARVTSGYGVNALASTPWNTAIGVSAFAAGEAPTASSTLAAWSPVTATDPAYAGGGGSSSLYSAPSWQPLPAHKIEESANGGVYKRLLPDLTLPSAIDAGKNRGLAFCMSGATPSKGCTLMRGGGSSAAAALFAGIAALVVEKNGPQGNLAPNLYTLSRVGGIFNDVQQGKAQLACVVGSPGCDPSGQIGFAALKGFDLATGLGSVDASALVNQWKALPQVGVGAVSADLSISPQQPNSTYNPSSLVTLAASVLSQTGGVTPTGSVTLVNLGTGLPLPTAPTANLDTTGNASLTLNLSTIFSTTGSYNIAAKYSGDATYKAVTSPAVLVTTEQSFTLLTVVPSTSQPSAGQTITVTVTAGVLIASGPAAGANPPTGLATLNLTGGPTSPSYKAALTTLNGTTAATFSLVVPTGQPSYSLQATYAGDANYRSSSSSSVTLTVTKGVTTTVLTTLPATPKVGDSLLATASVTATNPGTSQPSGSVSFKLDQGIASVQQLTPGAPSTATATVPLTTAGTHTVVGTYSGDSFYATSTSQPVTLVVAKGATVTTVTATPSTLTVGAAESFTATVASASTTAGTVSSLTGTVTFLDNGATVLGKAPVASNAATLSGITLSGSTSHSITAVYSGDLNWLPSTSAAVALVAITQPDILVLTANLSTSNPGQAVVLTATVTPTSTPALTGEQNPTGNVIFYNGATVIGEAPPAPVSLSDSSVATLTLANLPGGQDTIYAVYLGDLYYDAETSNLLALTIQDFTITPDPTNPATNLTIVKGSSGSATYIITGLGGFTNQIQVVCAVPPQDDMTCTASPQQVVPTGAVTFVVQTFASGSAPTASNRKHEPLWPGAAGGTALALLGFFLLPYGRRARALTGKSAGRNAKRLLILTMLLAGLGGAVTGCNSVGFVNPTAGGTPLGVATLKITASDNVDNTVVSRSVYLTVNVVAK